MGLTKKQLIDDIELRVTWSRPSADNEQFGAQLEKQHISLLIDETRDNLVENYLRSLKAQYTSDRFKQCISEQLYEKIGPFTATQDASGDWVVETNKTFYPLPDNSEIKRIRTASGKKIGIRNYETDWIFNLPFASPSVDNLYGRISGSKIYIDGLPAVPSASDIQVTMFAISQMYSPGSAGNSLDPDLWDSEYPIPSELIDELLEVVERKCLRMLDRKNLFDYVQQAQ